MDGSASTGRVVEPVQQAETGTAVGVASHGRAESTELISVADDIVRKRPEHDRLLESYL
ncbi:hypothetical protein [Streptomyces sp. NPDC050388]|uniref:hypothetical protein n=1 Tax=Streptomyces sp. NPDC050388 TaxID=3155781 RepID=UPI00342D7096